MVLVPVVAIVGENQVGIQVLLHLFKEFFDLRAVEGKESVAELS